MKFELKEQLGKYPILREIGSGATSRVYLARDPFADREVAIKVFLFDAHADPHTERMLHKAFVAEASLAGKLNHPHIVDILDAVVEPDHSYLVMEYVPGKTLEAHADVSTLLPLNKVGDFGASFQQRLGHETTQITGIGSPAYMSPEQVRMEALTHQTDIYSLGVTMYRLLTGRLPYQASTQAALTYAILNVVTPRPATLRPDLPPLLDEIVIKAINKDPKERYKSWLDFGKDLSQAFVSLRLAGESISESEKFNKLREFPFFEDFNDVALWEMVRIGSWKTVAAGTPLIREGEEGDSFYLLVDGEVKVTLSGKPLATLKPGACFGEILYFTERAQRRTTTVTTASDATVIEFKAGALRAATDACQVGFNKGCMRVLVDRLAQSHERITRAA